MHSARPRLPAAGPLMILMVFGGAFALLGLLMTFAVAHSSGPDPDANLLARNWRPLAAALSGLLLAAGLFGTVFRLHALGSSVGLPQVRYQPVAALGGTTIRVEAMLEPETPVVLEEIVAELHHQREARVRIVLDRMIRMDAGMRLQRHGELLVPREAQPGEFWSLVVCISVQSGADWREEHPIEILPG